MTNPVPVLSDDEVAEIEKHFEISNDSMFARSHIPALCATVRALRAENRTLRERLDSPPLIDPWKGDYDRD